MIPWLGFYWDDWPVLLTAREGGAPGFWEFYRYDRPFSAWTYVVMMPLLGASAPAWHAASLLLRWLTTVSLAWALGGLWPGRWRAVGWAVCLFAIYPVFTQQAIAVAYSQHWICYALYCFSLGCMVWAWRRPRLALPLTLLGAPAALVGLLTMEYFAGLELLRPLVLWLLASEPSPRPPVMARARAVLGHWLPYLIVLAGFVVWRLFFAQLADAEANAPGLLYRFPADPLGTLARLVEMILQDLSFVLVTAWANLVGVNAIRITDRFVLFSWGIGLLAAAAVYWTLREPAPAGEARPTGDRWALQALGVGAAALLLGPLPVWLTDRQITVGTYSNRFGLPAMLGASLVIVGLTFWLTPAWRKRVAILSLLVGLSVGLHLRTANDYYWSWVKQTRFYWQLAWRAPSIQPHTAIFSDGEIFPFVGLYSTTAGINLLYPPAGLPDHELPYYFYSLGRYFAHEMPLFLQGIELGAREFRMYTFRGNSRDALVIHYEPTVNNCLHVLSPADGSAPGLPALTRQALLNANLGRISAEDPPGYPPASIFGPEPEHDWCYLYQKAELARQLGDWEQVAALGEQAAAQGYHINRSASSTPFEWLPFIEAYARLGRWEQASELTRAIAARDPQIIPRACDLWRSLPPGAPVEAALAELNCGE